MSLPTNAKGRTFSWSLSALKDFEGCPRRYAASRFYYTVKFEETEAIVWGNRVHKAAELTLKGQAHNDDEAYRPVKKYVETMLSSGLPVEAEYEICLTPELKPTTWFGKYAWFRQKIDVLMGGSKTASHYDWKTGKPKDDNDQLLLTGVALSFIRPEFEEFVGRYIWLKKGSVSTPVTVRKGDCPNIWADFLARVYRMQRAWETETFPARPSGLCPWCQVIDCDKRR